MSAIITDDFRKNNANAFVTAVNTLATDSPSYSGTGYYVGIGKSDPWPDDTDPPTPSGSELERQDAIQNLISMKLLESNEIERLLPKSNQDWNTSRIYKRYDTTDRTCFSQTLSAGSITEYACYAIFNNVLYLCLSNGGGVNSTVAPNSAVKNGGGTITVDGEVGENSGDGYIWVRIGTIPTASDFKDSSTFFEIPTNITPPANSTQGLIYGFKIVSAGSGYTDDVHAATLRLTQIDGTTDTKSLFIRVENTEVIEVIDEDVSEGGTLTLSDFVGFGLGSSNGAVKASINFDSTQTFITECEIQPLIAPVDGFGSNNLDIFPSYYIGVKTDFENTDDGETLVDTKFRQVSIIKNPIIDKDEDSPREHGIINSLAYLEVATLPSTSSDLSGWYFKETNSGQKAWIDFIDTTTNRIYFHQNSSSKVTQDVVPSTGTIGIFNSSDAQQGGDVSYTAVVSSEHADSPEFSQFDISGEVIMLHNISPILRSAVQTEKVRIVLQF